MAKEGLVEEETFKIIRSRPLLEGDQWAVYQNMALDSANRGHVICLLVGPTRTHQTPPSHLPDGAHGPGWKYVYQGPLDPESNTLRINAVGVATDRSSSSAPNMSAPPGVEK